MDAEKRLAFQKITRKFADCEYSLGDKSAGFDCFNSLVEIYRAMGFEFPTEYKGFTEENYAERWSRGEGKRELGEFFLALGRPIEKNYMQIGDVIIFEGTGKATFAGTYLGNNHVLFIFNLKKRGGKILPLDVFLKSFDAKILGVRRMI